MGDADTAAPDAGSSTWVSGRCAWPVRTLTGCLVRAPAVVAGATQCGVRCLSFLKPLVACRVGGSGDMPVELLFPQGGGCIELAASAGRSRILGIDAVGGSPYRDFADQCCARVTSCCTPG